MWSSLPHLLVKVASGIAWSYSKWQKRSRKMFEQECSAWIICHMSVHKCRSHVSSRSCVVHMMKNYSKEIEAFALRFWSLWRYRFNKCRRLYGLLWANSLPWPYNHNKAVTKVFRYVLKKWIQVKNPDKWFQTLYEPLDLTWGICI